MKSNMSIHILLFLLAFLTLTPQFHTWGWFFSSSQTSSSSSENQSGKNDVISKDTLVAEFSTEALNDPKAIELVESAKRKLGGLNPCWFSAYQNLFSSCSEILAAEEKRSRLAWLLSDCFQKDTGRNSFPYCGIKTSMVDCLRKLNNDDHKTYLEFYLETNSICHQLQSKAFKFQVENLVNDLKNSALSTEQRLETIEEKSDNLMHSSDQIQESITSISTQTQQVGNTLKNMLDYIGDVLKHSKELNEQARGIATSQVELLEGQGIMKGKLDENMARVEESYESLRQGIETLQRKASAVEKEVNRFGGELSSRMQNLQVKADDIVNMAGTSLEKQQQLLESQSKALEGLKSLTNFQNEALQESRVTLQQIVGFAHGQHEELMEQKEQLMQAHEHLVNNSKSMLAAQEAFESRQASMFSAIEKLFALHNAMLLESRLIKTFFFYSLLIFVLYMFTSTKQTYSVRCRLYLGLCIAFAVECAILRFTATELEQKTHLRAIVKSLYGVYAISQLIYTYLTYRDYEALNHKMLVSLIEKVNGIKKAEDFSWDNEDIDSEVDWVSWVETELPEDVSTSDDPDYMISYEQDRQSEEGSIVTSSRNRYNLRRCRY